jgi:hypothetical protein
MDAGAPDKLLFGKRAAAALAYVGLASYDRVSWPSCRPGARGASRPCAAGAASSRCWPTCRCQAAPGPTDLAAAVRHYAAQITQRGPLLLISDLFDPTSSGRSASWPARAATWPSCTRCQPDELDPPLEGDLRLVDRETGDGVDITADLFTLDDYRPGWPSGRPASTQFSTKRRVAYVPTPTTLPLADLVFAELRRRRVVAA